MRLWVRSEPAAPGFSRAKTCFANAGFPAPFLRARLFSRQPDSEPSLGVRETRKLSSPQALASPEGAASPHAGPGPGMFAGFPFGLCSSHVSRNYSRP